MDWRRSSYDERLEIIEAKGNEFLIATISEMILNVIQNSFNVDHFHLSVVDSTTAVRAKEWKNEYRWVNEWSSEGDLSAEISS